MVVDPYARTVTRLGQLVGGGVESAPDADLMRRYVVARDESAFAALVRRHGPMVFGVCRRTLGHAQDAEDAFQATFLVLARKAHTVRSDGVGRWLYGVAVRVANKARVRRARRLAVQRELEAVDPATPPAEPPRDWLPLLDTALAKLADRDRRPILLCDLLGRSRAEAAAELGIAEGTLSSRLARARDKLRARLARLGAALSLPTLAAGLADEATATVPTFLIQSTVAAGTSAAAARELAEGVIRTMFLAKVLKLSAVGVCLLGTLTVGVVWLPTAGADPQAGGKETPKVAPKPAKDAAKPESDRERIQGAWIVESASAPSSPGPGPADNGGFAWKGLPMTFSADQVEFSQFPGTLQLFRLDPARDPKRIDFTFRLNRSGGSDASRLEIMRLGIYRFEGGNLRIVLGDEELRNRPDSFEPGAKSPFAYILLRRPTVEERQRTEQSEHALLQGTWLGLFETTQEEQRPAPADLKLVVKGDQLRLDVPGTDPLHASFVLDLASQPWHIDLTATADAGGVKKGAKVQGIFARQSGFLSLALGTGARPTGFEAAGKDGTAYVFVREGDSIQTSRELWQPNSAPPRGPRPKGPAKVENKRLRELQQERVKALETQLRGQFDRVTAGRDPLSTLIEVVRELADAELDLAETREAKLAAVERMLKVLREAEKQLEELQAAGLQTEAGVAQARAARLKAEIQLEKIKAGK